MPAQRPPGSNAWKTGLDEWGRVWKDGMCADGALAIEEDLGQIREECRGYMIAACNSISEGIYPLTVVEMFRHAEVVGFS